MFGYFRKRFIERLYGDQMISRWGREVGESNGKVGLPFDRDVLDGVIELLHRYYDAHRELVSWDQVNEVVSYFIEQYEYVNRPGLPQYILNNRQLSNGLRVPPKPGFDVFMSACRYCLDLLKSPDSNVSDLERAVALRFE